jgi:hypothetical protein
VQCVSLGRRRGLLVFIDQDDRPSGRTLGAALGALAKEVICRSVIATLRFERWLPGSFWWPGRGKRRRLLAETTNRGLIPASVAPRHAMGGHPRKIENVDHGKP